MLYQLLQSMFSTVFPETLTEPKKDDVSAPIPEAQEKSECAPVGKVKQNPLTDDIKRLEEAFSNGQPLERTGDKCDSPGTTHNRAQK